MRHVLRLCPILILLLAPAWAARSQSNDQPFIAFHSNMDGDDEIYLMDTDGGNLRQITHNNRDDGWLGISPDGSHIAFEAYLNSGDLPDVEIGVVDVETETVDIVTHNDYFDGEPEWISNDKIGYESRPDDNGDLRMIDFPPDGDPVDVISGPALTGWPDWSPDGSKVAYVLRGSEMDFGDIVVTYLDEDRTVDITHDDVFQGEAQWSPDGRVLAFSSFFDGDLDIYLLDVETGDLRQLTNNDADDMRPAWSPDGKQIVFASDRDGDFEIYVINVDGTNIRQLTDNHAEDHQPRWWGPPVPNVHVDISNAPRPKFTGPTGAPA